MIKSRFLNILNSKKNIVTKYKINRLIILFIVIVINSGCSLKAARTEFDSGNILVMPPSNAVQGGRVHPVAANSGNYLQLAVVRQLDGRSNFRAEAYPSDSLFSNVADYKIEDAVNAAAKRGFKYCLIIKLGEFRDAFPMTFRDDFVTLNEARLVDVQSNKDVWTLMETYRASGTNIGSYYPLLDEIAKKVASSILGNKVRSVSTDTYNSTNSAIVPAIDNQSSVDLNVEKLKALKKAREEGILTEPEYKYKRKIIVDAL